MISQTLQQKLQQKLSPQQIQMIKLVEVPTVELEDRIQQELEENPALEEGPEIEENDSEFSGEDDFESKEEEREINDDMDFEEYMQTSDEIPDYKLYTNNHSKDEKNETIPFSVAISFHEYLEEQLHLRHLSEEENTIAEYIIGNIDEEGYLRREIESVVDDLAFQTGISATEADVERLLKVVQDFEPAGIGARSLQECLQLQLERKVQINSVIIAQKIVTSCFEAFTKKHFDKIKRSLEITDEQLKDAFDEIVKLNPKPGNTLGTQVDKGAQIVVPDFFVEVENGMPIVTQNNRNIPELRVSRTYKDMLVDYTNNKNAGMKDAVTFVKHKLDSAKFFIDAIKQRQNTLQITMEAIVDFQQEFFLKGEDVALKPMILKDIAERTGLDISTISRVSNSKYVQTEFGIFPIKFFFSESMQTDTGEEVSSREIKSILQKCIDEENKQKPVTDEQLMTILKEKGYVIARRTVAKYREQLNIPVARLRKKI